MFISRQPTGCQPAVGNTDSLFKTSPEEFFGVCTGAQKSTPPPPPPKPKPKASPSEHDPKLPLTPPPPPPKPKPKASPSEHDPKLPLTPTTQEQDLEDRMSKFPPPPLGHAPSPPLQQDEFKNGLLGAILDKAKNTKKVVLGFNSVQASSLHQFFNSQFKEGQYVESEGYSIQVEYPQLGRVASITIEFKKPIRDIKDLSCINNLIQELADTSFRAQGGQARCVICDNIQSIINRNEKKHVLNLPSTIQDHRGGSSGSSGYIESIQVSSNSRVPARQLSRQLNKKYK